mmetsp:Transcript_37643/g.95089  ORF Transcript_37643/g.95089 Transcript_37643/m.95089 type:complete len:217 (-) Transcript_37643:612-1262(-)
MQGCRIHATSHSRKHHAQQSKPVNSQQLEHAPGIRALQHQLPQQPEQQQQQLGQQHDTEALGLCRQPAAGQAVQEHQKEHEAGVHAGLQAGGSGRTAPATRRAVGTARQAQEGAHHRHGAARNPGGTPTAGVPQGGPDRGGVQPGTGASFCCGPDCWHAVQSDNRRCAFRQPPVRHSGERGAVPRSCDAAGQPGGHHHWQALRAQRVCTGGGGGAL